MTKKILIGTIVQDTVAGADGVTCSWDVSDQYRRSPKINVAFAGSKLLLHQTNINKTTNKLSEDVIEVTTGQAYDLLVVLSLALGIAVRGFE